MSITRTRPDLLESSVVTSQKEEARARIREAGLRATPGRIAVYTALLEAKQPLTHNDMIERLEDLDVDPVTIYRNLVDLAEVGVLRRSDLGDHTWRFEIPLAGERTAGHPHFVCIECGDIQCLSGVELSFKRGRKLPRSIREKNVELHVRGVCDDCV